MHTTTMRDQLDVIMRTQEPTTRLEESDAWNEATRVHPGMAQGRVVYRADCGIPARPSRYDRRRIARQARALEVSR
jgi:hypothetical protein